MVTRHQARPDFVNRQLLPVMYLVVGGVVASQRGYLADLSTPARILSALVATVLWPLITFGAHITLT